MSMRFIVAFLFFSILMTCQIMAQGPAYIIAGGPSLSNQRVTGFQREPFLRYHISGQIESTSEISPNSLYARLGYHLKGSAVNIQRFVDNQGIERPGSAYAMEFHNISFSLGVKQRREFGNNFYFYSFGVRGDYNIKDEFGLLFRGLEGAQNKFTYGVNVDAGIELPLSDLIGVIFEIGISPDLAEQLFIPPQATGYTYQDGSEIILPETRLTNIVIEARVGFRFWNKIIYTD